MGLVSLLAQLFVEFVDFGGNRLQTLAVFFHLLHPVETGDISEKETQTNAAATPQGSLSSNLDQLRPSGVHTSISLILPLHKCLPGEGMRNVFAVRQAGAPIPAALPTAV